MEEFAKPNTNIRLGMFLRARVLFNMPGQKGKKAIEVVIFNQRHNPQTSLGTAWSYLRKEGI